MFDKYLYKQYTLFLLTANGFELTTDCNLIKVLIQKASVHTIDWSSFIVSSITVFVPMHWNDNIHTRSNSCNLRSRFMLRDNALLLTWHWQLFGLLLLLLLWFFVDECACDSFPAQLLYELLWYWEFWEDNDLVSCCCIAGHCFEVRLIVRRRSVQKTVRKMLGGREQIYLKQVIACFFDACILFLRIQGFKKWKEEKMYYRYNSKFKICIF